MLDFVLQFPQMSVGLPSGTRLDCHSLILVLGMFLCAFHHCVHCQGGLAQEARGVATGMLRVLGCMGVVSGLPAAAAGRHKFGICARGGWLT